VIEAGVNAGVDPTSPASVTASYVLGMAALDAGGAVACALSMVGLRSSGL
jgi:hypothetical protein